MKFIPRIGWLAIVTAVLVGCGSPDPTKFTCSNSGECPTAYFCDVAARHCSKGADNTAPALLTASWDKTSIQPATTATLTFTTSKPVTLATVAPETAIHAITVGTIAAVTSGAPNTYAMAFTAPAACDGAGENPADGVAISIGISFRDAAGNSGSGAVGHLTCDVKKTLGANAAKFSLVRQPFADGTVRTTINAAPGAVTSSPSFAGVSLVATNGTTVLGSAGVASDGSAQQFEVAGAPTQVSLELRDRTGVSAAVNGYARTVIMAFTGKAVPGTQNTMTAYDTATVSDSLYPPATWIASGPGPDGGQVAEIGASSVLDGGLVFPATYSGLAQVDGIAIQTFIPPQPDLDGGTPLGWEQFSSAPTSSQSGFSPSPRSGMTVGSASNLIIGGTYYPMIAYGGLDATNAPADSAATAFAFEPNGGAWTAIPQPPLTSTGTSPFPSNSFGGGGILPSQVLSRAHAAIGQGGQTFCTSANCVNDNDTFVIVGGVKSDGTLTDRVYAFGDKVTTTNGNRYSGWWDKTVEIPAAHLAYPNAAMAYADSYACVPSGTTNQTCAPAIVMAGGRAVTSTLSSTQYDANGCQFLVTLNGNGQLFQMSPCVDPNWATGAAAGAIGMRQAPAMTTSDASFYGVVHLFGGNRIQGPTGANGLQNDLWTGTITVKCSLGEALPCTAVGSIAVQQVSWTLVTVAASPKPSPRAGATIAFMDYQRLILYGGSDATGPRNDVWELDLTQVPTPTWRLVTMDAAPAVAPATRTGAVMLGQSFYSNRAAFLFGGVTTAGPTNEVWALSKQAPGRLLIKAPTGIADPSTITNPSLAITIFGWTNASQVLGWDGSTWRSLGVARNYGIPLDVFVTPSNPASYIQPDGNIYLLLNSRTRAVPFYIPTAAAAIRIDAVDVQLKFQ